jgi:hypothetical protein
MLDPFYYTEEPKNSQDKKLKEKLSFLDAFTKCRKQWFWVYCNPTQAKDKWPGFAEEGYVISHTCYMCEYLIQHNKGDRDCSKCPMLELWGKGYKNSSHCITSKKSAFLKWVNCYNNLGAYHNYDKKRFANLKYAWTIYKIRRNARKIIDFCDKKITLILSRIPDEDQY